MDSGDNQIPISDLVKSKLDRCRREGESYNDVLERILDYDEGDFYDGFGRWSDEHAKRVRKAREKSKQKSKERINRLAKDE